MSLPASTLLIRVRRSVIRWADIVALSLVGAITFQVAFAFAWLYAERVAVPLAPIFLAVAVWMATTVLVFGVGEPIRIRRGQWRRMFWYPPLWLAVVLAWVLAALAESLPGDWRPRTASADWRTLDVIGPILGAIAAAAAFRAVTRLDTAARVPPTSSAETASSTWALIERWLSRGERPIIRIEEDLLSQRSTIERLVAFITEERRSVALLGPFGSGKSSIINIVRTRLRASAPDTLVASMDIWAIPRPEDVPRLVLNRIVAELDDVVDTTRYRGLPETYQRLAAAEPSGQANRFLGVNTAADSVDELRRLGSLLELLDVRLLLVLEDVERAGRSFDTRHIQRMLWALREVPQVTILLAADPEYAVLDVGKLCDAIELVPPLKFEEVATILTAAHDHWMSAFPDIDPHPDRANADKLRLGSARVGGMVDYMRRAGLDTPLNALVSLIQTPRGLKHVLIRVDRAWRTLHGEVELDDLIIVSALRHGAEPAYTFLLSDIDAARHAADDLLPRTTEVRASWDKLIAEHGWGRAAARLVGLLGIEQLHQDRHSAGQQSPQGAGVAEPVDYFRRIVAEDLSSGELRDQTLLRDIKRYTEGDQTALLKRLVDASEEDDSYVARWEHFAFRHSDQELLDIVATVTSTLLKRDGASARANHPALISAWRRCNRRLARDEQADWILARLLEAVPVSLNFLNDFYYYWTGERGVVSNGERSRIRNAVVESLKGTMRSGSDLVRVLTAERPYNIGRLITETGRDTAPSRFLEWRDFLAPLLLQGSGDAPDIILAELANVAGDQESSMISARDVYPPVFINRYRIDRERMEALLGEQLTPMLERLATYEGSDPYAARSTAEAQGWLSERT